MQQDYTKLNKSELVLAATKDGIENPEKLKKSELIDKLTSDTPSEIDLMVDVLPELPPVEELPVEPAVEETPEPEPTPEPVKEPVDDGPRAIVHNGKTVYAVFLKSHCGDEVVDVTPHETDPKKKIRGPRYKALAMKLARRLNFDVRYE